LVKAFTYTLQAVGIEVTVGIARYAHIITVRIREPGVPVQMSYR